MSIRLGYWNSTPVGRLPDLQRSRMNPVDRRDRSRDPLAAKCPKVQTHTPAKEFRAMKHVLFPCVAMSLIAMTAGCQPFCRGRHAPSGAQTAAVEQQPAPAQQAPAQGQAAQQAEPCPVHGFACPPVCQHRLAAHHARGGEAFNPGPPVGQVTYPYYTVRGPRDFLQKSPTPIGP